MHKNRLRPSYLKVIEGQGKSKHSKQENRATPGPVYFLLLLLLSFLIIQTLTGWVWGGTGQNSISTILASESRIDVSFSVPGMITFDEKIVLAPSPGYVYFKIAEGQRVPVDKQLAVISTYPLEKKSESDKIEAAAEDGEPLQRFKEWFLGEKKEKQESESVPVSSLREETMVCALWPGLVSFCFEGLEEYGPRSSFPYLSAEELQNRAPSPEPLCSGEKVYRYQPLFKIVNNYYWYFSAIIPPDQGRLIAEKPEVKLTFSFAPEISVRGERVELKEKDEEGTLEITWRIGRELPGLYNQRRCEAEVVYNDLPGVLVPKNALVEAEGQRGVYVLEKGFVRFRKINLLLERENDVLVKKWEDQPNIVANPERVKEGQRYNW